jgi:hypothetical protein
VRFFLRFLVFTALAAVAGIIFFHRPASSRRVEVHIAALHDVSCPLATLEAEEGERRDSDCAKTEHGCGVSPQPADPDDDEDAEEAAEQAAQQTVQQTTQQS